MTTNQNLTVSTLATRLAEIPLDHLIVVHVDRMAGDVTITAESPDPAASGYFRLLEANLDTVSGNAR